MKFILFLDFKGIFSIELLEFILFNMFDGYYNKLIVCISIILFVFEVCIFFKD